MSERWLEGDGHKSSGWIPDGSPSGASKTWEETRAEGERQQAEYEAELRRRTEEYFQQHWLVLLTNMAKSRFGHGGVCPEERAVVEKAEECIRLLRSLDGSPGADEACRRLADSLMRGGRL